MEELIGRLSMFGYDATSYDEVVLDYCLQRAEQYIKNYCNINEIPQELHYALIDIAVGEFLKEKKNSGQLKGFVNLAAAVKSTKEGDTEVTYVTGEGSMTPEQRVDTLISYLLKSHLTELNNFRRLRW